MRSYGQYCPIARASEILGERWTPIIVRNLLNGYNTFGELAEWAPGLSRTLLSSRLRELERVGVLVRKPNPKGRGSLYLLTEAGRDLHEVMVTMGAWGERWLEVAPEHADPGMVLHSWCHMYLDKEILPEERVVVRFDFPDITKKGGRLWMIFDGEDSEVCRTNPGFSEDLTVEIDSKTLAEWHLGRIEWSGALRAGRIRLEGPKRIANALPHWNKRSAWAHLDLGRRGMGAQAAGKAP